MITDTRLEFIRQRIFDAMQKLNRKMDFQSLMARVNNEERSLRVSLIEGGLDLYFKITTEGFQEIAPTTTPTLTIRYSRLFFLKVINGKIKVEGKRATPEQMLPKAYMSGDLDVIGDNQLRDIGIITGFHVELMRALQRTGP